MENSPDQIKRQRLQSTDLSLHSKITWMIWEKKATLKKNQSKLEDLLSPENLERVVENSSSINDVVDDVGNTIFIVATVHLAEYYKTLDKLETLLRHGANINSRNVRMQSALTWAIEIRSSSLVGFLLSKGALVTAIDLFYTFVDVEKKSTESVIVPLHDMPYNPQLANNLIMREKYLEQLFRQAFRSCDPISYAHTPWSKMHCEPWSMMHRITSSCLDSELKKLMSPGFIRIILDLEKEHKDSMKDIIKNIFGREHFSPEVVNELFIGDEDSHPIYYAIEYSGPSDLETVMSTTLTKCKPAPRICRNNSITILTFECQIGQNLNPLQLLVLERNGKEDFSAMLALLLGVNEQLDYKGTSPLTLFLISYARLPNELKEIYKKAQLASAKKSFAANFSLLVDKFANIEKQGLKVNLTGKPVLKMLREKLHLPDALMVAFLTLNMPAVAQLLQFWPYSPAYLGLVFLRDINIDNPKFKEITNKFLSYGLPNGLWNELLLLVESDLEIAVCSLENLALHKIRDTYRGPLAIQNLSSLVPPPILQILLLQQVQEWQELADNLKAELVPRLSSEIGEIVSPREIVNEQSYTAPYERSRARFHRWGLVEQEGVQAWALLDPFCRNLMQAIGNSTNENYIVSPLSAAYGLAMLMKGSKDDSTRALISSALGTATGLDDTIETFRKISLLLKNHVKIGVLSDVIMANKAFVTSDIPLNHGYSEQLKDSLLAEVASVDFKLPESSVKSINNWMQEKTKGVFGLGTGELNSTDQLLLVNTLHMQARWVFPFPKNKTSGMPFYLTPGEEAGVEVQMMHERSVFDFQHIKELDARVVHIYCDQLIGGLKMSIVLPCQDGGLNKLEQKILEPGMMEKVILDSERRVVNLWLPKFAISSSVNMLPFLAQLGLSNIFNDGFEGISMQGCLAVSVSGMHLKAAIEVDEDGCMASNLYTEPNQRGGLRPRGEDVDFRCDRPFLYLVTFCSKIILVGRVVNPNIPATQ